jgi:pyruvate dehydrogenase phosphatase
MRRLALQTFRTARRAPVWKVGARKPCAVSFSHSQPLGLRLSSRGRHPSFIPATLQSSMHLRNFSLAVISTVVASGAWYAYQGSNSQGAGTGQNTTSPSQIRSIATDASSGAHAEEAAESTRRAILVDNDQFYTATLSGDQPLYKQTDDSDRRILEMLTPEQATQKLRKNEQSFLVNRGKGVVRYDVVQVPSNSPIEDDHAEKIVEVPSSVAAANEGEATSDWMFWAVFDGHS